MRQSGRGRDMRENDARTAGRRERRRRFRQRENRSNQNRFVVQRRVGSRRADENALRMGARRAAQHGMTGRRDETAFAGGFCRPRRNRPQNVGPLQRRAVRRADRAIDTAPARAERQRQQQNRQRKQPCGKSLRLSSVTSHKGLYAVFFYFVTSNFRFFGKKTQTYSRPASIITKPQSVHN